MYINVKVFPNFGESRIAEMRNNERIVRLKSSPEKGKANKELISLFANYYNVAKRDVTIVKGKTNKHKTLFIDIEGVD